MMAATVDLGAVLGTGGALASLRRCEALGFNLEQAVSWACLDPDLGRAC